MHHTLADREWVCHAADKSTESANLARHAVCREKCGNDRSMQMADPSVGFCRDLLFKEHILFSSEMGAVTALCSFSFRDTSALQASCLCRTALTPVSSSCRRSDSATVCLLRHCSSRLLHRRFLLSVFPAHCLSFAHAVGLDNTSPSATTSVLRARPFLFAALRGCV